MKYHLSTEQLNSILQTLDESLTVEDAVELCISYGNSYIEIWDETVKDTRIVEISLEAEGEQSE